jgi:hypothetical protein
MRPLCNAIFHLLKDSQQELHHLQFRSLNRWFPASTIPPSSQRLDIHDTVHSKSKLINLHHLKLYMRNNEPMWNCLATGIDFSKLNSLALYNRNADNFCEQLASSFNGRSTALEHVYATFQDVSCIVGLLECSENLTSLHLYLSEDCALDRFWRMIERRGPGLKCLGVQQDQQRYPFGDWNVSLSRLLSNCQSVQHLRLPISVDVVRAHTWKEEEKYSDFVVNRFFFDMQDTITNTE